MEQKHALGRRKSAVAFKEETLQYIVNQPFEVTGTTGQFDVKVTLVGGGTKGQAEAVRLGISRALCEVDKEAYRASLKAAGFLTRDAREVERKKPGQPGARRRFGRPNPATPVRMRIFPSYNKDCRDCGKIAETVPRGNATPD